MPIPSTRLELTAAVRSNFDKLQMELDRAGPRAGGWPCVDEWTLKELLSVRAWWTERVVDWIEAGLRDEKPATPTEGYAWRETPRLNADIVRGARRESYRRVRQRLELGVERVLRTVAELRDDELLDVGVFEWAGKYPISRWVSLNTTRQYATARTHVRRALRERS